MPREALYGFAYGDVALEYLHGLQPKIRRQIIAKISALASDPHPSGCKLVQGMKDGEDRIYRIRSGDYRVLFTVRNSPDHIVVLDIGHRKDIYR